MIALAPQPLPDGVQESRKRTGSLGRVAGLFGVATLLSRVLGLVRDQLFAVLLGASTYSDAFVVAFRIPNLLRDLFAEGALSSAFVPVFAEYLARRGKVDAFQLANRVLTTVVVVVSLLMSVAMVFPGGIVVAIAPGFDAEATSLTAMLTRIMLPFLPIVSAAAVCLGMLNATERFGWPALAPAMFNLVSIGVGAVLYAAGLGPRAAVIGWSIGTLLGGLAQLSYQAWLLRADGFRYRPLLDLALRDSGLRRIAALMGPAILGLAATQTNIFLNTMFASTNDLAVSYLNYAFRVIYLPIGVFGVAAGAVAGTRAARAAALGDDRALGASTVEALRYLIVLTIPSAVGLMVLRTPIVRLIYEHGRFHADSTVPVAVALACYAPALLGYASVKVLASAFYALARPRVAVLASFLAVLTNVTFNVLCLHRLGFRALALGTALGATVNAAVLFVVLHRRVRFALGDLGGLLAKVVAAAALMALCVRASAQWLERRWPAGALANELVATLVPIAIGAGTFVAACRLLGVRELGSLWRRRPRRLS